MSSPFLKSGLSCSVWVCVQLMNLLFDSILNFVQRFSFEATLLQMLPNLCFCLAPGKKSKVFFFFFSFLIFSACRLSPVAVLRILIAVASLVAVHGL